MGFCFIPAFLFFLTSCTSVTIIRDYEYDKPIKAIRKFNFQQAISDFPKKENTGFITSYEKAWIKFWSQKDFDTEDLAKIKNSFSERQYISLSQEVESLFLQESADGYIPSEAEVVSCFLLMSQIALHKGDLDSARIDLKKASEILQHHPIRGFAAYDDPTLRLWMATLWMALGEWNEAQVDLRRVQEMTSDPNIGKLLDSDVAPENWNLIFWGTTPNWRWEKTMLSPEFYASSKPTLNINEFSEKNTYQVSTVNLFRRHTERLNLLREYALQSNYMTQYLRDDSLTKLDRFQNIFNTSIVIGVGTALGVMLAWAGYTELVKAESIDLGHGEVIVAPALLGGLVAYGFYKFAISSYLASEATINEQEQRAKKNLSVYSDFSKLDHWHH
jgi:hypothetical protein